MTDYEIETACFNYLNGEPVGDMTDTVCDFMLNVILPAFDDLPGDEVTRIEAVAAAWFEDRFFREQEKAAEHARAA